MALQRRHLAKNGAHRKEVVLVVKADPMLAVTEAAR
jgi:hypothetical protein